MITRTNKQYSVLITGLLMVVVMFFSIIYSAEAAEVSIDTSIDSVVTSHNGSSPTVVFISDQTGYAFYRDAAGSCVYSKTTNGAAVWSESVTVDSQTDCFKIALWYDRWTPGDTTGTSIYILTMDTADLWYTQLDTAGDTLSTTINATGANQAGGFAVGANIPSITKGTDGDLYMGVQDTADAFVIKCAFGSDCAQAINWTEAGTNAFDLAPDWLVLMPLPAGNIMAIRWDISADLLQSKVYNDSGNSWDVSWDTIDLNAIENTTYDGHFGATLRKSNGDIYLAYVADVGTFGNDDDIRAAIYSSGIWTLKTDVVTNSTKGVTGVKLGFNEIVNEIYAVYTARTTPGTAATGNIYWKKSTDGMVSWGAEQGPVNTSAGDIYGTRVNAMSDERIYVTWDLISVDDLLGNTIVSTTPPPPPPIPPPPPPVPPGPPPPPSPSDGGSATPITQITFAGQAYPESTIEVSKKRAQDDFYDTVHADYILIHEDGRFEINEIGIAGGEYFYLLQIKDKDERKTTMSFDANLINQTNFSVKNIFAPPTLSLKKTLLARIEDLELQGYAAPRSVIEMDIDGMLQKITALSDESGYFTLTGSTAPIFVGTHYIKVRQIDEFGKKSDFSVTKAFKKSLYASSSADLNNDSKVGITDWSIFLFRWESQDQTLRSTIDLDRSGKVDIFDLSIFLKSMEV